MNTNGHQSNNEDLFSQPQEEKNSCKLVSINGSRQDLGFKVLKLDRSNFKPWGKLDADASEEEISKANQIVFRTV